MATGSSVSCISEDLTCAVCLDLFTNPRVLRCMHTYCHECMVGLVQTGNRSQQWKKRWTSFIVCPECRQNTNLDNRGVLGLATNFALSKVVETYRNTPQAPSPSNIPCSLCEDTSKFAVKTCLDCPKISYCDSCLSLFHPPRGVLKTHRLVAPSATDDPSSNNSKTTTFPVPSIESLTSKLTNQPAATASVSVSSCQEALHYHARCENSNPSDANVEEVVTARWAGTERHCLIGGLRHETLYLISVAAQYEDGMSSYSDAKVLYTCPKIGCNDFLMDSNDKHPDLDLGSDRQTVAHTNNKRQPVKQCYTTMEWDENCGICADRCFSNGSTYWEVNLFYQVVGRLHDEEVLACFGICQNGEFTDKSPLNEDPSCMCLVVYKPSGSPQIATCVWDGPHKKTLPCTILSALSRKAKDLRFGFFLNMEARVLKIILLDADFVLETVTDLGIDDALPICSVGDPHVVAVKLKFVTGLDVEVPSIIAD